MVKLVNEWSGTCEIELTNFENAEDIEWLFQHPSDTFTQSFHFNLFHLACMKGVFSVAQKMIEGYQ